jgi:hypothetical protein
MHIFYYTDNEHQLFVHNLGLNDKIRCLKPPACSNLTTVSSSVGTRKATNVNRYELQMVE